MLRNRGIGIKEISKKLEIGVGAANQAGSITAQEISHDPIRLGRNLPVSHRETLATAAAMQLVSLD